jgi:hypothetical protein
MAPTCQEETNQKLNNDIISIHAKMDHMRDHLASQIVELTSAFQQLCSQGPSSVPNPQVEGVDSSNPLHFHSNHDLHFPRVEVNKFDGSDETT